QTRPHTRIPSLHPWLNAAARGSRRALFLGPNRTARDEGAHRPSQRPPSVLGIRRAREDPDCGISRSPAGYAVAILPMGRERQPPGPSGAERRECTGAPPEAGGLHIRTASAAKLAKQAA